MVNDCTLYASSNTVEYYQFSKVILPKKSTHKTAARYAFDQLHSLEKTTLPVLLSYLNFKDVYSLQIRVLYKLRKLLYKKLQSITTQYIFIHEMITSKTTANYLYIV